MTRRDPYLPYGDPVVDDSPDPCPPICGWIVAVVGILVCVAIGGCSQSRHMAKAEFVPESGVNTERAKLVVAARPPKVRPLPRAGVRWSDPVEIREYSRPVETDAPTMEIYEVKMDGQYATFYALDKAIKVMLPAQGEETTVRFTKGNTWPGADIVTEGEPEAIKVEVPVPARRRGLGIGRTIRWIGYGAVAVAVIYLLSMVRAALKDARRDRQQDKMQNAFWMSLMGQFRGKK